MGSSRKSPAKKLPYKVLGKQLVHASYAPFDMEGISTVPVRRGWPKDDDRYWYGQKMREEALKKKVGQEEDRPTWHYELVYGPPPKKK
jgi:hypothetical protein